ncbi:MAG TPA: hypothetical protein DCL21_01385 [Alphaproteobacteria bacterium]|nr:hypothetical protein [Alphaproteobacteria bacterium]
MKNLVIASLAVLLASCSSKPLEKADLEYKVFPKVAKFKYEFNVAVPKVVDARDSSFVQNNDDYFSSSVADSLSNILFEEIRSTNSFETVALLNQSIDFNPTSTQIQEVKRTVGKDAIFLAQVNKFNANIRQLSDQDTSGFVNLKVFTNITYKLILADSESVIFLTTKDTSSDKVVPLNENIYRAINELAVKNIKQNIVSAKNDFILTTKGTAAGEYKAKKEEKAVKVQVAKEFKRMEETLDQQEAEQKAEQETQVEEATTQAEQTTPNEQAQETEQNTEETQQPEAQVQETAEQTTPTEQEPVQEPTQTAETTETETANVIETPVAEEVVVETPVQEVTETVETIVEAPVTETPVLEATPEVTDSVKTTVEVSETTTKTITAK